ncbi:unnamed protein product, partial [Ectocarpus sp. 12 AP-2014]
HLCLPPPTPISYSAPLFLCLSNPALSNPSAIVVSYPLLYRPVCDDDDDDHVFAPPPPEQSRNRTISSRTTNLRKLPGRARSSRAGSARSGWASRRRRRRSRLSAASSRSRARSPSRPYRSRTTRGGWTRGSRQSRRSRTPPSSPPLRTLRRPPWGRWRRSSGWRRRSWRATASTRLGRSWTCTVRSPTITPTWSTPSARSRACISAWASF